jgi:integrase
MPQAKTLSAAQLSQLLACVARQARDPHRDAVILLLSFRAGLRAQEIAGLTWSDVTDAAGAVASILTIPKQIAKKGHGRTLPVHPALQHALRALQACHTSAAADPVVCARNGEALSANAVAQHLRRLYLQAGLQGCSSHSGRRTFITALARTANRHGCSLLDIQKLAGHRFLSTTLPYIEPSDGVGAMIAAL